jgi:hypothetical protein
VTSVVAYVPDLMDRSRLGGVVDTFVASPDALVGIAADVVIVDLGRTGVLDVLASITAPVLGFGSHVDDARPEAARAAGCQLVLPRSRFFADPAAAIARLSA